VILKCKHRTRSLGDVVVKGKITLGTVQWNEQYRYDSVLSFHLCKSNNSDNQMG